MRLITSECVSYGHPDKIADQISDAILDAYLSQDPDAKVGVEAMVKDNSVILGGEVTSKAIIDFDSIIRKVVKEIGYDDAEHGFYWKNLTIINLIGRQSPEINAAVVNNDSLGAGDQGFMTGFATNETSSYLPLGVHLSRELVNSVALHFGPDVKTQVTMREDNGLLSIHTILVSTMHHKNTPIEVVRRNVQNIVKSISKNNGEHISGNTKILINPAGTWNVGGPVSDCGVTGRKIVVDQYGPYCTVGGGAYSGKDPSKVDRSGSYLCRYIAKNIVASKIAKKCKVEIAYIIGDENPASLNIDTFGDYKNDDDLVNIVKNIFPLKPIDIINHFNLKQPIYLDTAKYGHYGREHLPWEKTDKVDDILLAINNRSYISS